ncbi:hypothetical protein [Asticcacaulis sp. AND118]|uniref:hypothetical protein n=1 Tax=Asticcacaulis sp. AND118 TaxID=2840468 RepID=UPI001CFFF458|nr:hypothetical protein [Asticcacaulis sp. AND118]UDF04052.1 hypothetical protein LH365_03120 [Asticcacaulis sp. AND118]
MSRIIDFQNMQQIEALYRQLGDAECHRLGFVFQDERGVATLSTAGFGYLTFVVAAEVATVEEAFTAGYQCAIDFAPEAQTNPK